MKIPKIAFLMFSGMLLTGVSSAQCTTTTCNWDGSCLGCHVRVSAFKSVCWDCDTGQPFIMGMVEQPAALKKYGLGGGGLSKEGVESLLAVVGLRLPVANLAKKPVAKIQ